MATLIGLCIRVRLIRSLPKRFKVDVMIREGTHQSEAAGKSDNLFCPWKFIFIHTNQLQFQIINSKQTIKRQGTCGSSARKFSFTRSGESVPGNHALLKPDLNY